MASVTSAHDARSSLRCAFVEMEDATQLAAEHDDMQRPGKRPEKTLKSNQNVHKEHTFIILHSSGRSSQLCQIPFLVTRWQDEQTVKSRCEVFTVAFFTGDLCHGDVHTTQRS